MVPVGAATPSAPAGERKYPRAYPWSPAARAAAATGRPPGGFGLVIEHAIPRTLLVTELLTGAASRTLEEALALLLQGSHAAVITREDDRALTAAGLRSQMPQHAPVEDVWARYRAAGLDPTRFAPLDPS